MPNTQQIQVQGPVNNTPVNNTPVAGRHDFAFFSSGAITFGAMMAMLQAEETAMNDMAKLAVTTTNCRKSAILTTATATNDMYTDDANSLTQQSNEQWSSVASSFGSLGANVGGLHMMKAPTKFATSMDELHNQATSFDGKNIGHEYGTRGANPLTDEDKATHNTFKNRLLTEGISPDDYAKIVKSPNGFSEYDLRNLDPNNHTGGVKGKVTLKSIFESAKNPAELDSLRKGVGKGKVAAAKALTDENDRVQKWVQIGTSTAQAGTGVASSQFKLSEAQAMRDKGADSMSQALSQSNSALAQEAAKSQADQSEKMSNLMGQTWQSIAANVRTDIQA